MPAQKPGPDAGREARTVPHMRSTPKGERLHDAIVLEGSGDTDLRSMAIQPAERACCCAAPPVVRVLYVTAASPLHSTDLLLCGHHYRRSAAKLARMNAMLFDADGKLAAFGSDVPGRG